MSELDDLRASLGGARAEHAKAAADIAVEREQLRSVERALKTFGRTASADDERVVALERERAAIAGRLEGHGARLRELGAAVADLTGRFGELADPTTAISELSDRVPILLFPLRLETRFHRAGAESELWIRAYPDDCQIDGFEALPSESELQQLRSFWIEWWRAGGVEAQQRGGWRGLVGSTGAGRAAHLLAEYRPGAAPPSKARPQDVILVIVPAIAVSAAEQAAAFTYWRAVWQAAGDARLEPPARGALATAVGAATRADQIVAGFAPDPAGWDPPPPFSRSNVAVSCAVLELPPSPATKATSWTAPPRAAALPDRLVALLYQGGVETRRVIGRPIPDRLPVAPDPSLPEGQQITVVNGDLVLDDELRWIADFPRAVEVGMGLKVALSTAEARDGFDRLIVLGLRLATDAPAGTAALEELIGHQLATKGGYGLVPQGSPTNNTEAGGTPHSWVDDADVSFDRIFLGKEAYAESDDPLARRDGQWLAEALGIDHALVRRLPHAGGTDQLEARAMNLALWNATLGYALEEMCSPLVSRADIARTRQFFTRFVSGRGPLPAVRVGKQPYGILPAMAFAQYRATARERPDLAARVPSSASYLQRLHDLLARMDTDWRAMATSAAHVGAGGNPHQVLLDVVGLHPGSVEFHQRYAESLDQLYNKLTMQGGSFLGGLLAAWLANRGKALLAQLGVDPDARPPILEKFFFGKSPLLNGPVVDDVPLSETKAIRAYTPDNKNYLEWLAATSLDGIRRQDFGGNEAPRALLYLMLRHAMMLGQWDAGVRFLETHALIDAGRARLEPSLIHVQAAVDTGASKFEHLLRPQPVVTGDATTTLAEHVLKPSVLATAAETVDLREIVGALERLRATSTARLERAFADHIDSVSYRLDAWKTGLCATRLAELRAGEQGERARGLYLGAFGWLEQVKPRPTAPAPVQLGGELAEVFARRGDRPLVRDPGNAGYIHAPSLDHAATAAVLRNAYNVHATPAKPDTMAVNLSSSRVRQALAILDGMRNGQTLAALLGYRFERGLHDAHNLAEVDKFIYPLRLAFPLVANQLVSTRVTEPTDIKLLEARNVIDGLKLVERAKRGPRSYPFGFPIGFLPGHLPPATAQERAAIDREVDRLLDLHDALGDLTLAESVYQVVQGNFERAAAVTTALQSGAPPPEIQVVNTPRNGLDLNHRVALHLDPTADPSTSPSAVPMTPRARAEAPLNRWLAGRMPVPGDIGVQVRYTTPAVAAGSATVTVADLGLQPIDLLYLGDLELEQAMAELDDRIVELVRYGADAHPAMAVTIEYTQPAGQVSLFALAALIRSLRTLVLRSRPLTTTDLVMPLDATPAEVMIDDAELRARVDAAIVALTARRDALTALAADGAALDDYARKVSTELLATAQFGIPQTGTGHIHADLRGIYQAAADKIAGVVTHWTRRAADYDALLATYPALTTDEERFELLRRVELCVRAAGTPTPPSTPAAYRTAIEAARVQLDTRRGQLAQLAAWNGTKLADFLTAVEAALPLIPPHDPTPIDLDDQKAAVVTLRETLVARVTQLAADLTARITAAQQAITGLAALSDAQARVDALRGAARQVLGEEIVLLPRFRLPSARAAEITAALGGSGALLTDLVAAGRRFPVDDWLYGVARVRDKLAAWENLCVLSEAFDAAPVELTPLQLPFVAGDRWAALEFDTARATPGDRLLYTAHFAAPFAAGGAQCGLLLDEWPELVPFPQVMTGLTFHFDRPNAQPPQVMLLALPAVVRGRWTWDELVGAVTDALDGARSRAVEPSHVDISAYGQFVPATLMAVTLYWITIATNLALNNAIYDRIGGS